jgi:hypothetical protein
MEDPSVDPVPGACTDSIETVKTILEEAGSSLEKVIDVPVYLTGMKGDFDRFNKVYGEYFGKIQPTRTTLGGRQKSYRVLPALFVTRNDRHLVLQSLADQHSIERIAVMQRQREQPRD